MTRVYHDKRFPAVEAQERKFPDDFLLVAECDTDNLGEVFFLTNHVNNAWWENEGVKKVVEGQVRSTSCGDVAVLTDGTVMACAAVGWKNIGNIANAPLTFKTGLFGAYDDEQELSETREQSGQTTAQVG